MDLEGLESGCALKILTALCIELKWGGDGSKKETILNWLGFHATTDLAGGH